MSVATCDDDEEDERPSKSLTPSDLRPFGSSPDFRTFGLRRPLERERGTRWTTGAAAKISLRAVSIVSCESEHTAAAAGGGSGERLRSVESGSESEHHAAAAAAGEELRSAWSSAAAVMTGELGDDGGTCSSV